MLNISILMPCYNCAQTIERAVMSVISQQGWHELIMLNDGSSDNTLEIMHTLSKLDNKIKLIDLGTNYGAATARNIGAIHASGNILGFLDADDEHKNNIYSLAQEFLLALPQLAAVRFGTQFKDFPPELLTEDYKHQRLTLFNTFIPNLFIHKIVFNTLGGFPVDPIFKKYGGEDGVLSYLLQQFFLVGTNYENEMLIHHWHNQVHAENFLRRDLNDVSCNNTEIVRASQLQITKKSKELSYLLNHLSIQTQKGFIPVYKK